MTSPSLSPADHPRLMCSREMFQEMKSLRDDPLLAPYARQMQRLADEALDVAASLASIPEHGHNWHLVRARHVQTFIITLIVQYHLTGDERCRDAAMRYVQVMHDWEYWSWITWRQNNSQPDAIFDLSYGENSTTLALVYDWLHDHLTQVDKSLILAAARRPVSAYMRYFTPQADGGMPAKPFWFEKASSNWNTVCNGGIGMLALALGDALEQAPRILELVEQSITPYMRHLEASNGAWPEGIGYWNYGMRYAFFYLLSHERATGRRHWSLEQPATKKSLYFPLDFCPNGVPCSFGDVNHWRPMPVHQLVARRVGADDLSAELVRLYPKLMPPGLPKQAWPITAETLLMLRPVADSPAATPGDQGPHIKLYEGQDWGLIADQPRDPALAMTVRGGTTKVPHGHLDLTTFHVAVKDESLLVSPGVNEYLDTTFSPRRNELYDVTSQSKNVVLINGLGIAVDTSVATRIIRPAPGIAPGIASSLAGLHIDASGAMGVMRDGSSVRSYHRAYLMIDQQALLVVDNLILPHEGRCESRLHTLMTPSRQGSGVLLTGQRQQGRIALACNHPAKLHLALSLATTPRDDVHVLRWIATDLHAHVAFAALILPGSLEGEVHLQTDDASVDVQVTIDGTSKRWRFSSDLTTIHP